MRALGYVTLAEAERRLGVPRRQYYRWIEAGTLRTRRVGGRRYVLLDDLLACAGDGAAELWEVGQP